MAAAAYPIPTLVMRPSARLRTARAAAVGGPERFGLQPPERRPDRLADEGDHGRRAQNCVLLRPKPLEEFGGLVRLPSCPTDAATPELPWPTSGSAEVSNSSAVGAAAAQSPASARASDNRARMSTAPAATAAWRTRAAGAIKVWCFEMTAKRSASRSSRIPCSASRNASSGESTSVPIAFAGAGFEFAMPRRAHHGGGGVHRIEEQWRVRRLDGPVARALSINTWASSLLTSRRRPDRRTDVGAQRRDEQCFEGALVEQAKTFDQAVFSCAISPAVFGGWSRTAGRARSIAAIKLRSAVLWSRALGGHHKGDVRPARQFGGQAT